MARFVSPGTVGGNGLRHGTDAHAYVQAPSANIAIIAVIVGALTLGPVGPYLAEV